jgi:hypothetical protein
MTVAVEGEEDPIIHVTHFIAYSSTYQAPQLLLQAHSRGTSLLLLYLLQFTGTRRLRCLLLSCRDSPRPSFPHQATAHPPSSLSSSSDTLRPDLSLPPDLSIRRRRSRLSPPRSTRTPLHRRIRLGPSPLSHIRSSRRGARQQLGEERRGGRGVEMARKLADGRWDVD